MTTSTDIRAAVAPLVEIVVPVHNEEEDLERSVGRLHHYLVEEFPFSFRIAIADNASTDATWQLRGDSSSRSRT